MLIYTYTCIHLRTRLLPCGGTMTERTQFCNPFAPFAVLVGFFETETTLHLFHMHGRDHFIRKILNRVSRCLLTLI